AMLTGKTKTDPDTAITEAASSPITPVTAAPNPPLPLMAPSADGPSGVATPLSQFHDGYRKALLLSAMPSSGAALLA
ncbi:MAG: hypothetical protein IT567_00005, partial [Alphaproteobacteria bacterium]|nr:hypothetical protein [Alphaproteobacteria bacterium]